MQFKVGDVVKVVGIEGPKMTVVDYTGGNGNHVRCIWFDVDNHLQTDYFNKVNLRYAD